MTDRTFLGFGDLDGGLLAPLAYAPQTLAYIESARAASRFAATDCTFAVTDCRCCDPLASYLEAPGGWTDPATDYAKGAAYVPWYDPTEPASGDFLGFLLTGTDGLTVDVGARDTTPGSRIGGTVSRLRLGPREVPVQLTAFAATDAGMAWGRRWLDRVLRAGCVDAGCVSEAPTVLQFLSYCPDPDDECGIAHALRELLDVRLTAGPRFSPVFEVGDSPDCARHIAVVDFTVVSSSPFVFGSRAFAGEACGWGGCVASSPAADVVEHASGGRGYRSWLAEAALSATAPDAATGAAAAMRAALVGDPVNPATYDLEGDYPAWTDPDDSTTWPVVGGWDQPFAVDEVAADDSDCAPRKATAVLTITWASISAERAYDFSLALVGPDGFYPVIVAGGPQAAAGVGLTDAGNWRATPGLTQQVAVTTSAPIVGAVGVAFAASSGTDEGGTPDAFRIDALDLFLEVGCATGCACNFCRDFCHHPFQTCATPAGGSDWVPIVDVSAPDARGVRLQLHEAGASPCEPPADDGSGPGRTSPTVTLEPADGADLAVVDAAWVALGSTESDAPAALPATYVSGGLGTGFVYRTLGWRFDLVTDPPADFDPTPANVSSLVLTDVVAHVRYTPLVDATPGAHAFGLIVADAGGTPLATVGNGSDGAWVALSTWDRYAPVGEPVELTALLEGALAEPTLVVTVALRQLPDVTATIFDTVRVDDVWLEVRWHAIYTVPAVDLVGCEDPCSTWNLLGDNPAGVDGVLDGRTGRFDGIGVPRGDGPGPPRPLDTCCGPLCLAWASQPRAGADDASTSVAVEWVPRYNLA